MRWGRSKVSHNIQSWVIMLALWLTYMGCNEVTISLISGCVDMLSQLGSPIIFWHWYVTFHLPDWLRMDRWILCRGNLLPNGEIVVDSLQLVRLYLSTICKIKGSWSTWHFNSESGFFQSNFILKKTFEINNRVWVTLVPSNYIKVAMIKGCLANIKESNHLLWDLQKGF